MAPRLGAAFQRRPARRRGGRRLRLLVTTDQNLRYQQNLSARRIAIFVLTVANWPALEPHASDVAAAIDAMQPGEYREWSPP